MGKFVKLGKKASFFRDSNLDISIATGEVVELNVKQLNSAKVRRALNGGHLVYTDDPRKAATTAEPKKEPTVEELAEAFTKMVLNGDSKDKIMKTFNLEELKALSKAADIELEPNDTKSTICDALIEDCKENNKAE